MFSPAKEKGPNVLQMCGWNVSSFHEGIRESKDAIHTANTLFHNQWNTGGDSADKKRFKRSTWNESDLWVPGSQARKWGQLLVYMNKMATDGHWWGSKAVVCASVLFGKARATQTWLACEVQLLSPSSSEIIIVCSPPPLFFFFICFQAYCYFYASLAGTWINHCRTWFTTCIPDIAPSKAGKRDKYIWTPIVQCLDLAPGDVWKCKAEERGWFLYHLYQLASEHRIGLTVSIVRTWVFHSLSVSPSLKDRFVFPTLVAQSCNSSWMAFLN